MELSCVTSPDWTYRLIFVLWAAPSINVVLALTIFKTQSVSLATYYFVDITVTTAVKKDESEIEAWVSVAPGHLQLSTSAKADFCNMVVLSDGLFSAGAGIPKQPGELPAPTPDGWTELLYPCNNNPKLQPNYSCNDNSSAKQYKHNCIGSFTKQQHNYSCKNYSSTEQQPDHNCNNCSTNQQ